MKILFLLIIGACVCASGQPPIGTVVGWGENLHGQCTGTPWPGLFSVPLLITNRITATGVVMIAGWRITNAVAVAASQGRAFALTSDGKVLGWGANGGGAAVGHETPYPQIAQGEVSISGRILSNIVSIAAGRNFGVGLKADGRLVTWGENALPPGLSDIMGIAAGGEFTLAVRSNGTVVEWSSEHRSLRHMPVGVTNVVAVAVNGISIERSLALKKGGAVVVWGDETIYNDMQPQRTLTNVVSIAAGFNHSLALKQDGTVEGWGFDDYGQATGIPHHHAADVSHGFVTVNDVALTGVTAISAANEYSLALKKNGTVVAWGHKARYSDVPATLSGVVAIAAGEGFCLAITTNTAFWNPKPKN